jgi:hypothetical protein
MKKILLLMTMAFIPSLAFTQIQKFEGTMKPDSAVLKLLTRYGEVFDFRDVAVRDAKRKELVSPAYFYHGMDGAPIGLDGLTKRQIKNDFKVLADSVYDEVLYQYENMAVLIFKEWQHIQDKGVEKKSVNSVLILLARESGHWKVVADIIGQKPKTAFDK